MSNDTPKMEKMNLWRKENTDNEAKVMNTTNHMDMRKNSDMVAVSELGHQSMQRDSRKKSVDTIKVKKRSLADRMVGGSVLRDRS